MRRIRTHAPIIWVALGFGLLMAAILRSPALPITYAQGYPAQTQTAQTATPTPTTAIATTPSITPLPATTSIPSATPIPLPTFIPNPTLTPTAPVVNTPPTPIASPAAEALICAPGAPIVFHGKANPHSGLLLYFAGRPVSGGVADSSGIFNLTLTIGNERPGVYSIAIYTRGSWKEIIRTTCTVPSAGT